MHLFASTSLIPEEVVSLNETILLRSAFTATGLGLSRAIGCTGMSLADEIDQ